MSALTPDEEAELSDLTRRLFAPGAAPDEVAQQRYAQLGGRRREGAVQPPASGAEPAVATAAEVPPARPQTHDVVPEPAAALRADAAVAGLNASEAQRERAAPGGESANPAMVASTSEREPRTAKRAGRRPNRKQLVSAGIGFAVAAVVTFGVQAVTAPRPVYSGSGVAITLNDVPPMGEYNDNSIGNEGANARVFRVDDIPGVVMIMTVGSTGTTCAYLSALENPAPNVFAQMCNYDYGPLVWDFPLNLLHEGPRPDSPDDLEWARIIVSGDEYSIWENPPTGRAEY